MAKPMCVQIARHLTHAHIMVLVLHCFGFMPSGLMVVLEMGNTIMADIIPTLYLAAPILVAMDTKAVSAEVVLVEVEQGQAAREEFKVVECC